MSVLGYASYPNGRDRCGVHLLLERLESIVSTDHSNIHDIALSITKKYGFNQCLQCSTALRQALIAAGRTGVVLKLKAKGARLYVVMKDPDFKLPFNAPAEAAISETGLHYGVQVGEYVFDNIHRSGILRSKWVDSFDCAGHAFEVSEIDPF